MEAPQRRTQSRGRCEFCGGTAAKSGMRRHLVACADRAAEQARYRYSSRPALHLTVEGAEDPTYWMHLEAAPTATLKHLDDFLRDTWLECCGHLSAFEIDGTRYAAVPDDEWGDEEESMNLRLSEVLGPGMTCRYEYDYGSTTRLKVRVWSLIVQRSGRDRIVLLARNEEPYLDCVDCGGGPSVQICVYCRYENGGSLCEECAGEHECGEDFQLPAVNSPRAGICGYTGEY